MKVVTLETRCNFPANVSQPSKTGRYGRQPPTPTPPKTNISGAPKQAPFLFALPFSEVMSRSVLAND